MTSSSFRGEILLTQEEFLEFNKNLEKIYLQIYGLESSHIPWRLCPIDQTLRTHTPSSVSLAAALRELDATVDPSIILNQTYQRRSSFKQESSPPTPSPRTPSVEVKAEPKPKLVVQKVEYDKNSDFYKLLNPEREKLDKLPEWARELHKLLNEICHNSYIKPFLSYFKDRKTKDGHLTNGVKGKQSKKSENDKMDDLDFDDLNDDLDDILMDIDQNTPQNGNTLDNSLTEQDLDKEKTKDDNNLDKNPINLDKVFNLDNNVKVEETKGESLNGTVKGTDKDLPNNNHHSKEDSQPPKEKTTENKSGKQVPGIKNEQREEPDTDTKHETNYNNTNNNSNNSKTDSNSTTKNDRDKTDNDNKDSDNSNKDDKKEEKQTIEEILENLLLNKFENSSRVFSLLYSFFVDRFNELTPGSDDWMCAQDASLKLDELRVKKGLKDSEKLHNYPEEQPVQPVVEAATEQEPPPEPKRQRTSMEDFEHELALINNTEDYTSTISIPDVKKITDNERLEFYENVTLLDQEFHLELFTVFEHAAVWKLVGNGEIELDDQNTDPKIYRGMIKWVKERSS